MKVAIIAVSTAALIAAAPAAFAQAVPGKTPGLQHNLSNKHRGVSGHARLRGIQHEGSGKRYPGALGYAPPEPNRIDRDLEMSRQAGGGGGGGGGGM